MAWKCKRCKYVYANRSDCMKHVKSHLNRPTHSAANEFIVETDEEPGVVRQADDGPDPDQAGLTDF